MHVLLAWGQQQAGLLWHQAQGRVVVLGAVAVVVVQEVAPVQEQ
jgi:hypothetical protein